MGFFGALGSYMFGGPNGFNSYAINKNSHRGGFGTTVADLCWQGMTGTRATDSALAGGRMRASMMNLVGANPTMMAYSGFAPGVNPALRMPVMPYAPMAMSPWRY